MPPAAAQDAGAGHLPVGGRLAAGWHMLDHAWELEDRDLTNAPA